MFASDLGIYAANLDGTGLTRLTRAGDDDYPVWSPDAKLIAFARFGGDQTGVMVMNADGSGLRRVGLGDAPAWSPNGSMIAFQDGPGVIDLPSGKTIVPGPSGFTVVKPDGTGALRFGVGDIFSLSWSPDGKKIAYSPRNEDSIRLVDLRSGAISQLATVNGAIEMAWSPDGRQLAVVHSGRIDLVDAANGRMTKLTDGGRVPVWSPDSTRIAFIRDRGDLVEPSRQLLTIGRDGRDERRLDVSSTDDWTVSWCGDGRTLVFSRSRSAGAGSDIWRIGHDGRDARAITHAFPTGGNYSAPQCAAATLPVRPVTSSPTISLRPSRLLTTRAVLDLAADEGRAAVGTASGEAIWNAAGSLTPLAGSGCDFGGGGSGLVLAGNRVAEIEVEDAADIYHLCVAVIGAKPDWVEVDLANLKYYGEDIGNLMGDGKLLVYNTWTWADNGAVTKVRLRRVVGTARSQVSAGANAFAVVSVDAGRIAVLRKDGTLVILDEQGRRLSAFALGWKGIETGGRDTEARQPVRLAGSRLVVLRGTTIEVRDAARGTVQHRWPTARSEAATTLEDAHGNFAVYTAGIAIHLLRLSDGRDRLIAVPNEEGPANADLEPEGLYYSYNTPGSSRPGRVAFVPAQQLAASVEASAAKSPRRNAPLLRALRTAR